MATGAPLDRLARAVKRSSNNPAWLPRPPQLTMHQGTLTGVDPYNGLVDFQFPDPSGIVLPSVGYIRSYSDSHLPEEGHVVWGFHYGTDFMIAGQHVRTSNLVIP